MRGRGISCRASKEVKAGVPCLVLGEISAKDSRQTIQLKGTLQEFRKGLEDSFSKKKEAKLE